MMGCRWTIRTLGFRAGEMTQHLKALAAMTEDWGSVLSTHMAVYNHQ